MNPDQQYVARKYSDLVQHLHLRVPDWQRLASDRHVQELFDYLHQYWLRHQRQPVLLGCLTLCCVRRDGTWLLIDGQHRFKAMERLYLQDHVDLTVMCCDVKVSEETDAMTWFDQVNKALPVERVLRQRSLQVPNRVVEELARRFKDIFKDSDHPRRPHLNKQILAQRLTGLEAVKNESSDVIVAHLLAYNDKLKAYVATQAWEDVFLYPGDTPDTVEKAVAAAEKKGCFLGLFKDLEFLSWCFDPAQPLPPPRTAPTTLKKKAKVPERLRQKVWDAHVGETQPTGQCYACAGSITQRTFEAGHVVAEANGGPTILSNLRPVCTPCNRSCGTRNLEEFKAQFQ